MTSFEQATEPFRRELLAHCYRMLGSRHEAEDVVQETYLRAWRSFDGFEGRSSVRVWLYRIATNACLNALRGRRRRELPSTLDATAADVEWLEPLPDALVTPESDDPAAVVTSRHDLRLALIAGLQHLPPRQRAVLILREVLAIPATEVARMLDTTVASVKSALQRARATLDEVAPTADDLVEPTSPRARALLSEYIAGFENSDLSALERALRADASLEVAGSSTWFAGRATCLTFLATVIGTPGDWRMHPTTANDHPATYTYHQGKPWGMAVLTTTTTGIARLTVFPDPTLVPPPGPGRGG
ncbi:RNA polymerase ECF family sigma subunit [Saccharothrix carnea]|uniref:RNA polymerase ECF family sigma subunit n=1 Tax=Saccharothrix carnea TaxID=1280637 RepID=A0A2P8I682_SACCR|nr:RNA polymerase subunit sigma-70 [Saccharothrix carnea]PSL53978.1 RNA polymerase ECF family sigma subunit [Saccharothrix carnea]